MPETIASLVIGAVGGAIAATVQYGFRRYAESGQVRREIVETHLLQLQNSAESLYYRAANLQNRAGKTVMSDEYYRRTSAYVLGRVLAHEFLLVSKGVYAKLHRNTKLKGRVKSTLHGLNWAMDDQVFLYYHRLQLGEMILDGERILTYTEFLRRWEEPKYAEVVTAVSGFVARVSSARLDIIKHLAADLVVLLAAETKVPSAMELAVKTLPVEPSPQMLRRRS
jgi:hypothetical protein